MGWDNQKSNMKNVEWVHKNGTDLVSKEETGRGARNYSHSRASMAHYTRERCTDVCDLALEWKNRTHSSTEENYNVTCIPLDESLDNHRHGQKMRSPYVLLYSHEAWFTSPLNNSNTLLGGSTLALAHSTNVHQLLSYQNKSSVKSFIVHSLERNIAFQIHSSFHQ